MFADEDNRTRIKICGITSLEDARFVAGALADYMGFIFYEKSKRYIDPGQAGAIINWLEGPSYVGVFVNQPLDEVNDIARQTGLHYVQLHGEEKPEYCGLMEKPVIKAIHVGPDDSPDDLRERVESYLDVVEYLLFDTKNEEVWGGSGKTFDWSVIKDITDDFPFFLSGGLNADNIREACRKVSPYAVDLSSGVEMEPGVKDYNKIEQFFDEMREIWKQQEVGEL